MNKHHTIRVLLFLAISLGVVWAQSDSGQQPSGDATPSNTAQQPGDATPSSTAPQPAFGQNGPTAQPADNPPLSGLDQPSLEPGFLARSFLIPGVHVSESADSNVGGSTGSSAVHSVTRAGGSLALQKLWNHYTTTLDYIGGAAFYSGIGRSNSVLQELNADERVQWRTGQLILRDSFAYEPEGTFGYGSFGGSGGYPGGSVGGIGGGVGGGLGGGIAGGGGGFFGGGQLGSLGQQPRINNLTLAEIAEALTPRSQVTLTGGYGFTDYIDNTQGLINSEHVSLQVGYNHQISRHDQIGLVAGFQGFRYPITAAGNFNTYLWHVLYGHRITGRLDLVAGGGPQLTIIHSALFGDFQRLSVSGRASLRYRLPKGSMSLEFSRYTTSGSGFFAGANTNLARLSYSRPLGRNWEAVADIGYAHNSRLQQSLLGVNATSYQYGYIGGSMRRQLGRYFSGVISYQFHDLSFDGGAFSTGSHVSQRHVALIGLDWHPRPIRLD